MVVNFWAPFTTLYPSHWIFDCVSFIRLPLYKFDRLFTVANMATKCCVLHNVNDEQIEAIQTFINMNAQSITVQVVEGNSGERHSSSKQDSSDVDDNETGLVSPSVQSANDSCATSASNDTEDEDICDLQGTARPHIFQTLLCLHVNTASFSHVSNISDKVGL